MLDQMTPFHLQDWREFYKRNPFGSMRTDAQAKAIVAASGNVDCDGIDAMFPWPKRPDDDENESNVITGKDLEAMTNAKQAAMQH